MSTSTGIHHRRVTVDAGLPPTRLRTERSLTESNIGGVAPWLQATGTVSIGRVRNDVSGTARVRSGRKSPAPGGPACVWAAFLSSHRGVDSRGRCFSVETAFSSGSQRESTSPHKKKRRLSVRLCALSDFCLCASRPIDGRVIARANAVAADADAAASCCSCATRLSCSSPCAIAACADDYGADDMNDNLRA